MAASAILLLLTAISTAVIEPRASCIAGIEQAKRADYKSAQELLWECVLSGGRKQTEAFYLGLTYRELKNYDAGLAKAQDVLKQAPENEDMLYLSAFLHYRKSETKESMIYLSRAYKIEPDDWRIHQLFALNYALFLMPDAVETELKAAIRLNPANAELHYQLGRFYFSEELFQDSIDEVNRALAIAPEYPQAYDSLGLAYEGLQDSQRAAENYRKAIELDRKYGKNDEWPLIDYGTLLLREESLEASVPYLKQALNINPRSPQANYQMGRAMRGLKHNAEAEEYFEKTIAADPQYSYAYFQLAALAKIRGDQVRASELMQTYKALMKRNAGTGTYNPAADARMAR